MLRRLFYKFPGLVGAYHYFLARLGAVWHKHPGRKIFIVGVTGTKGKTTTLELINAILEAAGKKTALLTSYRIKIGERTQRNLTGNSMPGRFFIQRFLNKAVRTGCDYALIEVTSEGVVRHRHRFIEWNIGILTNLSPEHIESHGSFRKYRRAKLSFLEYVVGLGGRVFINKDGKNFQFFSDALKNKNVVEFSKSDPRLSPFLSRLTPVQAALGETENKFFLSDFNAENVAAAVAVTLDLGIEGDIIDEALRDFPGVPGRLEFIRRGGKTVVIDYAHTPDSLEAVYRTLMALKARSARTRPGRLICVLGAAGGGRDKWKRPVMGKVASMYCDRIILTSEDPYDESPEKILAGIKAGVTSDKGQATKEILNRREAISAAVRAAGEDDIVVVTGKGSENWLHVADGRKIPWNERQIVEETLSGK